MKNLIILLLIGMGILFSGCTEDLVVQDDTLAPIELKVAKKPAASMVGIGECAFTLTPPYFWNGTVDFGDAGEYKATYESLGPPRDYSMASPFEEYLYIYDINASWPASEEEIYLTILHSGVLVYRNSKFTANGKVINASGPLENWMDCNTHVSGLVSWVEPGLPSGAEWTLRLN